MTEEQKRRSLLLRLKGYPVRIRTHHGFFSFWHGTSLYGGYTTLAKAVEVAIYLKEIKYPG